MDKILFLTAFQMENKELIVRMRNELNLSRIKGYGRLEYLIYEYLTTQIGSNPYEPVKIRAIDLLKATKIGETNHVFLRKTTRNMIVGVEILTETKDIIQVPTFQKITYKKGGEVEFQFSKDFVPYIFELKERFTERGFGSLVELKSEHARPLYLLCMQFKNLPQKRDFYLSVDELRFLLDLPKNQYKQFADIKRRILKPATEQITKSTDIKLEFEVDKPSRKIEGVKFYFSFNKENGEQPSLPYDFKDLSPAGRKLVDDYLMSPKIALELQILASTDEHLIYAIDQHNKKVDSMLKKGGSPIENPARYIEKALREQLPLILASGVVEKQRQTEQNKLEKQKAKLAEKQNQEQAELSKKQFDDQFKKFCDRSDLLELLKSEDLETLLKAELSAELEPIVKQANKESLDIFSKEAHKLAAREIFEVLTSSVKGLSFSNQIKPIKYRNIKVYLKHSLKCLF